MVLLRRGRRFASTGELDFKSSVLKVSETGTSSSSSPPSALLPYVLDGLKPLKGCMSTSDLLLSSSENKIKKTVSFHNIQINEMERVLGDNPSVSSGPALALGWDAVQSQTLNLEDYERLRPERRSKSQMKVPRRERETVLREQAGVTRSEMSTATKATLQIKSSRRKNSRPVPPIVKIAKPFKALGKILKPNGKNDDDEELNKLMKQGMRAEQIRQQLVKAYEQQILDDEQQRREQEQKQQKELLENGSCPDEDVSEEEEEAKQETPTGPTTTKNNSSTYPHRSTSHTANATAKPQTAIRPPSSSFIPPPGEESTSDSDDDSNESWEF